MAIVLHLRGGGPGGRAEAEPPPELEQMMKEMDALSVGEPAFFDLKDPWMHAPG